MLYDGQWKDRMRDLKFRPEAHYTPQIEIPPDKAHQLHQKMVDYARTIGGWITSVPGAFKELRIEFPIEDAERGIADLASIGYKADYQLDSERIIMGFIRKTRIYNIGDYPPVGQR